MAISKVNPNSLSLSGELSSGNPLVTIDSTGTSSNEGHALKVIASGRGSGVNDVSILSVHNANGELLRVQNAGGISFNGDTAAANALDDYEEGTWTPAGSANVDAISSQSAFYTKIGNKVTVSFYANIDPTNNTQTIGLSGLPFAVTDKIVGTQVEATGVVFEDTSLFLIWAQGGTSVVNIEFDRPMEGSASTAAKNYRASITYFSD